MCGLCGLLTNKITDEKIEIFKGLMTVSTLRGQDGAGIAAFPKKGRAQIFRAADRTAADLAYGADFHNYVKKNPPVCLLGHARFPTSGGFEVTDCHPHVERHIIGTHNGTLTEVNGRKVQKNETDSKLLFAALSENNPVSVLEKTVGSFAVAYVNKQTGRLVLARNKDRPLHTCMVDGDPSTVFWASEPQMLELVVGRRVTSRLRHYRVNRDTIVSFRLDFTDGLHYESTTTFKPKSEGAEVVPIRALPAPQAANDPAKRMHETCAGLYVTAEKLVELLRKGCYSCASRATLGEYTGKNIVWFSSSEFLCLDCLTHDYNSQTTLLSHHIPLPKGIRKLSPPVPSVH